MNRNAAVPWLYVAGGAAIGLVAFRAASTLKQRRRGREPEPVVDRAAAPLSDKVRPVADLPPQGLSGAALQESGEIAAYEAPHAIVEELVDDELELALSGDTASPGEAYDAVAPDDLGSEWLTRATEASAGRSVAAPLALEIAELFRDAGMSVVSEGSLNAASAEQIESAASEELDVVDDQKALGSDERTAQDRNTRPRQPRR